MRIFAIPTRIFRLTLWYKILRSVQGCDARTQLGLLFSAILDTVSYLINPSSAISPKIYISGIIRFKFQRSQVYFYVRDFSDDLYNVMPEREGDVNDLIISLLERGCVFVDVGANVGYYSILAGKIVGDKGQIIAVEPIPETCEALELNVKLNKLNNVRVMNEAAWSSKTNIEIWLPKCHYGFASVFKRQGKPITVKAIPLDDLCKKYRAIKLLKIDAEGSEYQILRGAKETLKKTSYVILEVSENAEQILELLRQASFKIHKLRFTTYVFAEKV